MSLEIEEDLKARVLALDGTKSFIVQAPAGSGKTELLIQRFLALLNQVDRPEEILSVTFTKKAANEMRNRLLQALKNATRPKPLTPHAIKTWELANQALRRDKEYCWQLLENPNQLRIQTIDSLCSFLTKQLPLLASFGAQPKITQTPFELYREAVSEVIKHLEEDYDWSFDLSIILTHLDNDINKLSQLLTDMLSKRDQWLPYIHLYSNDEQIKISLENQIKAVINEHLDYLKSLWDEDSVLELLPLLKFSASSNNTFKCFLNLTSLPKSSYHSLNEWMCIANFLLTKNFSWRKKVDEKIGFPALSQLKNPVELALHKEYREKYKNLIDKIKDNEALQKALTEVSYLPDPTYKDNQWRTLQSLLHVLKVSVTELRLVFEKHGEIDFIENALSGALSLGTDEHPSNLALSLDYHFKHILIDEYQDTSFTQQFLLERLTAGWQIDDGRTLFVVGDPMQSIYRFRQAEVGLFVRLFQKGLPQFPLIPLKLSINFRSHNDIVSWNNKHFKDIFPKFNDIANGAVSFSKSIALQNDQKKEAEIKVIGLVNGTDSLQAQRIGELIKHKLMANPSENIAILTRSRTHLKEIIPALKQLKIKFNAVDIDLLANKQFIVDLLSLTKALINPADRLSWLSIFRAPWCGLNLYDLHALANKNKDLTILEIIEKKDFAGVISTNGLKRLLKTVSILQVQIKERLRNPLRNWVEETWNLLGGPATLNALHEFDDVKIFFDLLDDLDKSGEMISLHSLTKKINELYSVNQSAGANISIMTIHAAKGLEFDTVIIPHLEKKMPVDDKPLLAHLEQPLLNDRTALLLAPMHALGEIADKSFEYINRRHKDKNAYETERLFYVGTTRAKKRLYLYFNTIIKSDNADSIKELEIGKDEIKIESNSFLEKLWSSIKNSETLNLEYIANPNHESNAFANQITEQRRLKIDWQNPFEIQKASTSVHKKNTGFQLQDQRFRLIGITIHRVLHQIGTFGINWWTSKKKEDQNRYVHIILNHLGITNIMDEVEHVLSVIETMLSDDKGLWILKKHEQPRNEYELSAILNHQPVRYVIDRTFIDENQIRWIIDYKTTTFNKSELDEFINTQQNIYLKQMKNYHDVFKLVENNEIRLGLYFPAIPTWKEWTIE